MNRLKSLQLYPVQQRRVLYFAAPLVLVLFTFAILVSCFGFSFQEVQEMRHYLYIPGFVGAIFLWYAFHNIILPEEARSSAQKDIEADPIVFRKELERSNRSKMHIIWGMSGVFVGTVLLHPPFFRELGQLIDLVGVCCFLAVGAYFREVLHVYSRVPGISDKEIGDRYGERRLFLLFAWATIGFFFLKALGLNGKMGDFWSGLPELPLQTSPLVAVLAVYLVGVLGVSFQAFAKRAEESLSGLFNAALAFGSTFLLVWLYSYLHPFLFVGIPAWLIQLPCMFLVLINSVGIYFSFQSSLREKIWGNTCIGFVRSGQQVLVYIFVWASAVMYADMSPAIAALLYGALFAFLAWGEGRFPLMAGVAVLAALIPFFLNSANLLEKLDSNKARVEHVSQETAPQPGDPLL